MTVLNLEVSMKQKQKTMPHHKTQLFIREKKKKKKSLFKTIFFVLFLPSFLLFLGGGAPELMLTHFLSSKDRDNIGIGQGDSCRQAQGIPWTV